MDLLGKKSIFQWDKNGVYASEGDKIYISKDNGLSWAEFYTIGDADNIVISPDGKKVAFSKAVQVEKLLGKDKYADFRKRQRRFIQTSITDIGTLGTKENTITFL
jgi:hypothetical protein